MTDMKRLTVSLTPELERTVIELRKTERFCRCSFAEIIRYLLAAGAAAAKREEIAQ